MVAGLDTFQKHFAAFSDCYVLIGGTASSLAMEELGAEFRATKDLDIVLCVEALHADFGRAFWEFVRAGGYESRQQSTGERRFYRFQKPTNAGYPFMLELFSRAPDALVLPPEASLTPIPMDEEVSSLSAILMNAAYYGLVMGHREKIGDLSLIKAAALIPLKARAYLDLGNRAAAGEAVDSKNIKKHRNDIFRLFTTLTPGSTIDLTETVKTDMATALTRAEAEMVGLDLNPFGITRMQPGEVIAELRRIYGLITSI
ncbi:MAG: hypothetical protein MUE42_10085 [Opitutaceae bacterium]|jgi:hypothetical protein|nr:hypothetical protein [Opitutaceae bacterium]